MMPTKSSPTGPAEHDEGGSLIEKSISKMSKVYPPSKKIIPSDGRRV